MRSATRLTRRRRIEAVTIGDLMPVAWRLLERGICHDAVIRFGQAIGRIADKPATHRLSRPPAGTRDPDHGCDRQPVRLDEVAPGSRTIEEAGLGWGMSLFVNQNSVAPRAWPR